MTDDPLQFGKELRMKGAKLYHCPHCGVQNTIRHKNKWKCHSCHRHWTPFSMWYYVWFSRHGKLPYVSSIVLPLAAVASLIYLIFKTFQ